MKNAIMNKSKEYIISCVLFGASLILFCLAGIMGLAVRNVFSMDNMCLYLGFSFLCFGFGLFEKTECR